MKFKTFTRKYIMLFSLSASLIFLLLTSSCGPTVADTTLNTEAVQVETESISPAETERFSNYTANLFRSEVANNTLNLHYTLTEPKNYGILDYPITLGKLSDTTFQESLSSLENMQAALKNYDDQILSAADQLTCDVLSYYADTQLSFSKYYLYDEILKPNTGIASQLPILLAEYAFNSKQDVKDYLGLLADMRRYFDQIIEFEIAKSDAGLFMSDFAADAILKECSSFCAPTEEHYLVTTFRNKLASMDNISEADKEAFLAQNEQLITTCVLPAYEGLSESLTALKGTGKNEMGLCYLPNGRIYYANLVHNYTGSPHTVEELEEMTAQKRADDLRTISTLTTENPTLSAEASAFVVDTSQPEQVLKDLIEKISTDFPVPVNTNFTLNYVDESLQDSMAPAFYLTAPIDDLSRNSIYINPGNQSSGISLFTTLAHEGFPGHLYQTVMSYDAGLSPIRSIINFPGYVEGWATYVEMMSFSYSGLPEDAALLLSSNQSAILSLYASTDMGIHYEGWNLSDTIKFFRDYGITDIKTVQHIYEYIIEEPSHYLKYYIGYLEFLELRDYAKELYGEAYTNKQFHQAVLSMGPAPFDLLEKYLPQFYK